jgi:hypothetical protein
MMKLKPNDLVTLRKHIDAALMVSLKTYMEEHKKMVVVKINSNNLMHTALQPEGDTITIQAVVEVHEKTEPSPTE